MSDDRGKQLNMQGIPFEVGKIYNRQLDIHGAYKGQSRSGIVTPGEAPFVFLFTGSAGHKYGYADKWTDDGVLQYVGEGQEGDMEFVRGNKAIRDHSENGKDLLVFGALGKGEGVRFLGQFSCASWEYGRGPDINGNDRRIIVFHLIPFEGLVEPPNQIIGTDNSLDLLRAKAYEASKSAIEGSSSGARSVYYKRSQDVRTYVLVRAHGICEACLRSAPFNRLDGTPYLEPHHTRRVSDGGPDHPLWVGAICPNCHREIHHGEKGRELNTKLQEYIKRIEQRDDA
jgi:5-methylcytosine-specific restriction protein A